jgi:hypothetical protein
MKNSQFVNPDKEIDRTKNVDRNITYKDYLGNKSYRVGFVTDKEILSSLKANNITIILTFSNLPAASVAKSFSESNGDGVCFNPAEFVRCDEKPFLVSYRVGRFIKSVEQLDINDAIWTGESTRLAKGNSEIKELISIFRCRNFSGYMVLGGGIKYPGSLEEAYNDFKHLLANM